MSQMVAFGANCSWWNLKQNASRICDVRPGNTSTLPCCPKCGGVLYETELDQWWASAEEYEKTHPHYLDYLEWAQGKCFPTTRHAQQVWEAEHLVAKLEREETERQENGGPHG